LTLLLPEQGGYDAQKGGPAMIELSDQQRQELEGPEPARARDPLTNETYVLVRADVYEKVRRIIAEINERADWDDPAFDVYDNA
jgi:hypothetical protein